MGEIKLSVIEEQITSEREQDLNNRENLDFSDCECPCWAFLRKNSVIDWYEEDDDWSSNDSDDEIASTASWNID